MTQFLFRTDSVVPRDDAPFPREWCDQSNNVWVRQLTPTLFEVSHRHTGGVFPRLFPPAWAPDRVLCLTHKSAARAAARMVWAYQRR